jgi:hypothetical protein
MNTSTRCGFASLEMIALRRGGISAIAPTKPLTLPDVPERYEPAKPLAGDILGLHRHLFIPSFLRK